MDELLKKLIEVDKNARKSVARANKAKAQAMEELENKKRKLRQENEAEFAGVLEEKKREKEKLLASTAAQIEENCNGVIAELDSLYNEKGDEWVEAVFSLVTTG